MKLNKNVGKNCYPDPSDVMVVQTALASIKHKTKFGMKPIWDGKVDGKNSKELACAIDHFQCGEHMKMTGKIEPYGPTINKLKQRIPASVRNSLSQGIATAANSTTGGMQKVKSFADRAVSGLKGAPLPQKEAEALSKIIKDAAGVGVPLFLDKVDITSDGRFEATMGIDRSAYPSGVDANKMKKAFIEKISQFVGKYGAWQKGFSSDLKYKSTITFAALKGTNNLTNDQMGVLGLSSKPSDKVVQQCCSGLAQAIMSGRKRDAIQLLDNYFTVEGPHKRTLYASLDTGVMTDAQFEVLRPHFDAVWNSFYKAKKPTEKHISEVLGGFVLINARLSGSAKWKNFCAVRISHALNKAGDKIPFIKSKTVSSSNKEWHLYTVANVEKYLTSKWGSPDIHISGKIGTLTFDKLKGQNGLLIYKIPSWDDATGHATLWDGSTIVDDDGEIMDRYLNLASELKLWILP